MKTCGTAGGRRGRIATGTGAIPAAGAGRTAAMKCKTGYCARLVASLERASALSVVPVHNKRGEQGSTRLSTCARSRRFTEKERRRRFGRIILPIRVRPTYECSIATQKYNQIEAELRINMNIELKPGPFPVTRFTGHSTQLTRGSGTGYEVNLIAGARWLLTPRVLHL